jgi:exosortase K
MKASSEESGQSTAGRTAAVGGLFVYFVAACAVVALQILGRKAGADNLGWILAPTATLAGWFSGIPFSPAPRGGYLNLEQGIAIGPGCAGIRFFTMTLLLGMVSTLPRIDGSRKRWAALAGVFGGAYLIAILANASRIAGAIMLLRFSGGWGGPAKAGLHLAAGIVVFASYLALASLLVRFAMKRSGR